MVAMKKPTRGPALYELISDRGSRGPVIIRPSASRVARPEPSAAPPPPPPVVHSEAAPSGKPWLSAGKSVRVPVGYLFLAAAAFIAIAMLGYTVGYNTHKSELAAALKEQHRRETSSILDPTLTANPNQAPAGSNTRQPGQGSTTPSGGGALAANAPVTLSSDTSRQANQNVSTDAAKAYYVDQETNDPRRVGLNYWIIAHVNLEEANRIVDFLAANGISAARLPPRRGVSDVVVLEGFQGGELSSDRSREYQAQIKRLGRDYKRQGGAVDFSDMWPKKHSG